MKRYHKKGSLVVFKLNLFDWRSNLAVDETSLGIQCPTKNKIGVVTSFTKDNHRVFALGKIWTAFSHEVEELVETMV